MHGLQSGPEKCFVSIILVILFVTWAYSQNIPNYNSDTTANFQQNKCIVKQIPLKQKQSKRGHYQFCQGRVI